MTRLFQEMSYFPLYCLFFLRPEYPFAAVESKDKGSLMNRDSGRTTLLLPDNWSGPLVAGVGAGLGFNIRGCVLYSPMTAPLVHTCTYMYVNPVLSSNFADLASFPARENESSPDEQHCPIQTDMIRSDEIVDRTLSPDHKSELRAPESTAAFVERDCQF